MKKLTKIITVLLVLAMMLSALASCNAGTPDESKPESSSSTPESSSTPKPEESKPDESDDESDESTEDLENWLPPKMDLDREMNVLSGKLYYDEWLTKDDGDIVGTELYNRIPKTEQNLGITLNVEIVTGTDLESFMQEVKKRHESTDPNMIADLVSSYSQLAGSLTLEGRYQTINNSDYIDLENPWWPADLLANSTIDDKVYFVSGDISPTLIYETYAIFYNVDLVERYNLGNPIELVNNKEWTLDKVIELTSGIFQNLDNTDGVSTNDFLAFNFNDNAHLKAFPFAMGIRVILPDEDDGYVWSDLYMGGKMEIIADKMTNWIRNNNGVTSRGETGVGDYGVSFKQGNCIFTVGNFAYAAMYIAGAGINYGVVPCPLYDSDQENYYSYYGNPTSFWGIPTNAPDLDEACALLEYLAAEAYVYISPALFERALKLKYVTGQVDGLSKMFDIIRDGLVFDACMFYNRHVGSSYNGFSNLDQPPFSWSAGFTGFKVNMMNSTLQNDIVAKLRSLEY